MITKVRKSINSKNGQDFLEKCFQDMLSIKINSVEELEKWIVNFGNLEKEVSEVLSRDYINLQCHNDDEKTKEKFIYDQEVIMPLLKKYQYEFDKYLYTNKYKEKLGKYYNLFITMRTNSIEIFREENIALEVEEANLSTDYYDITGKMTALWEGEEKTIQQVAVYAKDPNRAVREKTWKLIQNRRIQEVETLDEIMNNLVALRHKQALNAGLNNYRDYKFKALERFDYTPEDCEKLHESVLKYVVPLKEKIEKMHKNQLNIDSYKPWDVDAVPESQLPLKPYNNIEELVDGTIRMLERTDKFFADTLKQMKEKKSLDLESRKWKSPGGFCDYFHVSKVPFIFMNGVRSHNDLVNLTHEVGHSIHSVLCSNMKVADYSNPPSESAELASMGMELLCMDKWDEFYKNNEDLIRAKRDHLEGIIKFLPWAVTIDKFQHWIYLNPYSSPEERNNKFSEIASQYVYSYIDWTGYENNLKHMWKAQLHIYEMPFYFIEYAIAQLGALQLWRQYTENPEKAIENYKKALALGSSKSVPEVYETAGIKFDFSGTMIDELMKFTWNELEKLY